MPTSSQPKDHTFRADILEAGSTVRRGRVPCRIGQQIKFGVNSLGSYFLTDWQPLAYDALLVAASIEFCDHTKVRPSLEWGRKFELSIPVHDPSHWRSHKVYSALQDAVQFLTGDKWQFEFTARKQNEPDPRFSHLNLRMGIEAVIPFSNGVDSLAVASIVGKQLGGSLVRVRLGGKRGPNERKADRNEPFTSVPYKVSSNGIKFRESSSRSRGFKFLTMSGIAAYQANANLVIVPESGQGSIGTTLVAVGQIHPDYRNHPSFLRKMELYLKALLGEPIEFRQPRIWHTKGETLAEFIQSDSDAVRALLGTRSCWQGNRQVGVNHHLRQCGICAACLLRRMSFYSAGLVEPQDSYVWESLDSPDLFGGATADFAAKKKTGALREYAIAGALHMDHLANLLKSLSNATEVRYSTFEIANDIGLSFVDAENKLKRMIEQHATEWRAFLQTVGPHAFIKEWVPHS